MSWYKIAKEVSHNYSWVYVNLPTEIKKKLIEFGKEIDPEDLYVKEADEGIEKDPHITVKYAILTNEFKVVRDLLNGEKGGRFYLGESTIFENDKFDVVKIEVESKDLLRLHDKLNNLQHEDKHPKYQAHATIAYVKPGKGKKYVGKFKLNKTIKFNEAFFGDQDRKDHKIKLASNGFNLFQHKYAQIWNVDVGDEGIEEKIAALYELEYKYSMVRDRFNGHPERKSNILNNLQSNLEEVMAEVKKTLVQVFGNWLSGHALLDPDLWSNQRMGEDYIENVGVEACFTDIVSEYIRYTTGASKIMNSGVYDAYFSKMLNEAKSNLDKFPVFTSVCLQDYKMAEFDELSNMSLKEFGERHNKKFRNRKQAGKFIDNLTISDVDTDSLFYSEGISDFAQAVYRMGYAEEILKEFNKNFVFPYWAGYWKSRGIEETRENIEKVYEKLNQINTSDIRNSLVVINLALNTAHQNGYMLDYIAEFASGSGSSSEIKSFLDEMSSGSKAEEWNIELREVGVSI